jgi:multicomponent Na+:H+ antiporter subunit A
MIAAQSPAARLGVAAATPLASVIGVYLLFAGHNNPGGGFAAGLVFGCILALQRMTGLRRPFNSSILLGAGLLTIVATAALPLFWNDVLLDQAVFSTEVPLVGKVKTGTALIFDIGVTAVVVGLVAALLDGLGMGSAPGSGHEPVGER